MAFLVATPSRTRFRRCLAPAVRMHLLLGGPMAMLGWMFAGVGLVMTWIFAGAADLSALTMIGPRGETVGVVTASRKTSYNEGRSGARRGTPVYATSYAYEVDGRPYEGVAYATGRTLPADEPVTVEYL